MPTGRSSPVKTLPDICTQQYSQAKLEALYADPDVTGLVAEVDGAVAGYAKLYHARAEQRFYMHQLYILPSKQGLGLGHRLMARAEELARELGADRIWLGVMVKNAPRRGMVQEAGLHHHGDGAICDGLNHGGPLYRLPAIAAAEASRNGVRLAPAR